MSRGRVAGLLAVLALLSGALVLGSRGGDDAPAQTPALARLRAAAALAPCPAGLSPELPALQLPCVGAPGTVRTDVATGRPAVVNLWGTWCPPCVEEVPLLQGLHARTSALDVVGVLTKDSTEHGLQFSTDPAIGVHMSYPSVLDEQGTVLRQYGGLPPVTLFVRPDGHVAHVKIGRLKTQAELDGMVRQYLGVRV